MYWEDDFSSRTAFSSQQAHAEFKPSIDHDAFQHELDEPSASMEDTPHSDAAAADMDVRTSEDDDNEGGDDATDAEVRAQNDHPQQNQVQAEVDPTFDLDEARSPHSPIPSGIETDTDACRHTRGQISAHTALAMSTSSRTHFFFPLLLGRYAPFIRWDRRGAVVTRRFDSTTRPALIFNNFNNNFNLRCSQPTPRQSGFAPPKISPCPPPEADIGRTPEGAQVVHVASIRLGGDVAGLEPETLTSFSECVHDVRHREPARMMCHRIVLDTIARDLSSFSWCKVLLSYVADAVEGACITYFRASDANCVSTRRAASIRSSRCPTPRYQHC
jgi:hypothetical protein